MLNYFIGCIPLVIFTLVFNLLLEKIKIHEKLENFDSSNSGSVYDFFKCIFLIIMYIIAILSISVTIFPAYIFQAFNNGDILLGVILTLTGSIMLTIAFKIFDQ